jgi:hypothetical protein
MSRSRETHTGGRALPEHFPPKTEQLGRTSSGAGVEQPGPFDETAFLDESTKILLVKPNAHESLDYPLKL